MSIELDEKARKCVCDGVRRCAEMVRLLIVRLCTVPKSYQCQAGWRCAAAAVPHKNFSTTSHPSLESDAKPRPMARLEQSD